MFYIQNDFSGGNHKEHQRGNDFGKCTEDEKEKGQ